MNFSLAVLLCLVSMLGLAPDVIHAQSRDEKTVQTTVRANILSYVEEEYTLQRGEHYDTRRLLVPLMPKALPREQVQPEPERTLESSFDVVVASTLPVPDLDLAVGPNHVVAVNNVGVFAYLKDGTSILNAPLTDFFSSLAPINAPFDPHVVYDEFWDRFVVLAIDTPIPRTDSDLLIAVSESGNPAGPYHQTKIPTLLPNFDPDGPGPRESSPHRADAPRVGVERSQIYISFNMFATTGAQAFGGSAVWNISKWAQTDPTPLGGFYDGQTVTIQAGIRPFSMDNDYDNETALTPVEIHGEIVGSPVDRGIFLAAYGGSQIADRPTEAQGLEQALQLFWLTSVGPTVSKTVVPLGIVDDLINHSEIPPAPQRNGPVVATGDRLIYDGVWRDGVMWLVTTVVPPSGADAGEVTAHWTQLNAPNPSTLTLTSQGDISGDTLVSGAFTYYPSLDISSDGRVAVGFSVSAPDLELSSAVVFLGTACNEAMIEVQPELLRRGSAAWTGSRWGDYSGIDWDSGHCFWVHNAHPVAGAPNSWTSTVGEFCFDPLFIFGNSFESGTLTGWCL